MAFFIKEEPIEYSDESPAQITASSNETNNASTSLDKNFESESFYLHKLNENVLNSISNEDMELFSELMTPNSSIQDIAIDRTRSNQIVIEDILEKIGQDYQPVSKYAKSSEDQKNAHDDTVTSKEAQDSLLKQQLLEKLAFEKKRILMSLIETAKEKNAAQNSTHQLEKLSLKEENTILNQLTNLVELGKGEENSLEMSDVFRLHRFKAKLEVRSLKREKHVKLFDIDSYVNELIDSEKTAQLNQIKHSRLIKQEHDRLCGNETAGSAENTNTEENEANDQDNEIIFEHETLKESLDGTNNCQIVAVTRVLDRFNSKTNIVNYDMYLNQMPIGMVESRNDDIKCVISPFSKK